MTTERELFDYCVICGTDNLEFRRMVELHLNDGTGYRLAGGVSITMQFNTVHYAQALMRDKWE